VNITWYGTAGFGFEAGGRRWLVDPYLSRNRAARPVLDVGVADVSEAGEVFLSHGHFDHAYDVPQIVRRSGATVYCSRRPARTLRRLGVDAARIVVARDGDTFDLGTYRARCFNSTHVRPDLATIVGALMRVLDARCTIRMTLSGLLPLALAWPRRTLVVRPGQVLAWRFTLAEDGGCVVQHFGSAGCTGDELARLGRLGAPDVLLVPLQGHRHIHCIAAHIVERLKPRIAIPHHHDDFCPPISQRVDVGPFIKAVKATSQRVWVIELPMGKAVALPLARG